MAWAPKNSIYVVGYSRLGQRVATALEQAHDWTYMEFDDDGETPILNEPMKLETLGQAIDRMKNRGAAAFAMCPWQHAPEYLGRLHQALEEGTTEH